MNHLKGKTYEEVYGKDRAIELKRAKSKLFKGVPKSIEHRNKLSKTVKAAYANGSRKLSGICNVDGKNYSQAIGVWNAGLSKDTDERVKQVAEKIRKTENNIIWKNTIGKSKKERIIYTLSTKEARPSWNKGLTKTSNKTLALVAKKLSNTWKNKPEKEKEHLRQLHRVETIKRNLQHPYKRFTNTKPEQAFTKILDTLGVTYKKNYPLWCIEHVYPADFYLPEHQMVIEIDGEYFHNFPLGTDRDIIRECELSQKGIFMFRIWVDMMECIDLDVLKEMLDNIKGVVSIAGRG